MGCCAISPTNEGFRIELNDNFKKMFDKREQNLHSQLRMYDEKLDLSNTSQLVTLLDRRASVSPIRQQRPSHDNERINTLENQKFWKPRPSFIQSTTSPLNLSNRSSYMRDSQNQYRQQTLKILNISNISQHTRSHSAINSYRNASGAQYTQVSPIKMQQSPINIQASPIKLSPLTSRVSFSNNQNLQVKQQQILVINDFNCAQNTSTQQEQINKKTENDNIWNYISNEINQFASRKNKDQIKITLNGENCKNFIHSDQLIQQITPKLANQGIIVDPQNIFVKNEQGQKQIELAFNIIKQNNQNQSINTNQHLNPNKPSDIKNLQVSQDFTLQNSQDFQNGLQISNTSQKLNLFKQEMNSIEDNQQRSNLVNEYDKGASDSEQSLYQYKKSNSKISTNNNSKNDLGSSIRSSINSSKQQALNSKNQNKIYQPLIKQDEQKVISEESQLDRIQSILQKSEQTIKQFTDKHENKMVLQFMTRDSEQQQDNKSNSSIYKTKLSNMKSDEPDQSSKISFIHREEAEQSQILHQLKSETQISHQLKGKTQQNQNQQKSQSQISQYLKNDSQNSNYFKTQQEIINQLKDDSSLLQQIKKESQISKQLQRQQFSNENIQSQKHKQIDQGDENITYSKSIKKCQEIKSYLKNKINNDQNNKPLDVSENSSLRQSRQSCKDSKNRKANQILQEISNMIYNSSTYSSETNTEFHKNQEANSSNNYTININTNNIENQNNTTISDKETTSKKDVNKINQLLNKLDKLNESYKRLNNQIENEIQHSKTTSLTSYQDSRI